MVNNKAQQDIIMLIKAGKLAKLTETTVETIGYYEKEQLLPMTMTVHSEGNYQLYNAAYIE